MLIAVLSGYFIAILLAFTGKFFRGKRSILLSVIPLILFIKFISLLPKVSAGEILFYNYPWVPSMGINFSFYLDGLSLLFCLLITGIGTLVFLYTSVYLKNHLYLDRFFGYLSMFMASMLGLVLSDNIFILFIFWELTSISSFFLIGFNNSDPASRKSAIVALGITGGGGFLLLAGLVILNSLTGIHSIQEMRGLHEFLISHPVYPVILLLIFGGAFTKSAQFPFHFWLPGAMKAPTPVSTYLHSATMVKAGIFLLARFTPVLGNHDYWHYTLTIVGGITMLYAAFHAVFRTDLKSILAYSTISALGILVFLIGLGSEEALLAAAFFILVHALYKASLFLVTGIIDHYAGTRDVTRLRGLGKVMLPVAIAAFLAAISNSGIPPTMGFIGKDLIYATTSASESLTILLTSAAVITHVFLIYAGFVAGVKPFSGKLPEGWKEKTISPVLWGPPLLLGVLGILFGIFPAIVGDSLVNAVVLSMGGSPIEVHLQLWHGFNFVLLLSAITIASGLLLYFFLQPSPVYLKKLAAVEFLSPGSILGSINRLFKSFSSMWTNTFQNGYLRYYLITILSFTILLVGYRLLDTMKTPIDFTQLSKLSFYEVAVSFIMLAAIFYTVNTRSRLAAVASMGVVGYSICLIFVFYSAPDLAMTQFSIDTLTVILFVLVLYRLPNYLPYSSHGTRIRDIFISTCFGLMIVNIALEVLAEPRNREISEYYAQNAYLLAKGKNVVNVILVDFRGLDTMMEISVLTIAALGVFSLLKLRMTRAEKEQP